MASGKEPSNEAKTLPQEKKKLAYDRDHVTLGFHSGTAFRETWRRKDAAAEQAHRRAWSVATHELAAAEDPESLYPEGEIVRKKLRKSRPPSVRELVAAKKQRRINSRGRKARSARAHAETLAAILDRFLEGIVLKKVVARIEALRDLDTFIAAEARANGWNGRIATDYIRENPAWQMRLRKWRRRILERRELVGRNKAFGS